MNWFIQRISAAHIKHVKLKKTHTLLFKTTDQHHVKLSIIDQHLQHTIQKPN